MPTAEKREHQADEQQHRAQQRRRHLAPREVLATVVREQPPLEHRRDPEGEHEHDARGDRSLDERRRLTFVPPIFHFTSSISSSTVGSTPVSQSTAAIQAIQETLRSRVRTQGTDGRARVRIRTMSRMTTSRGGSGPRAGRAPS
jgi:hypothetical protein